MRKKSYLLISILCLLLISGCSSQAGTGAVRSNAQSGVTVRVQEIKTQSISETCYAVGTLQAEQKYEITSNARGNIENIYVNPGDKVSSGTLLFTVNYAEDIKNLEISKKQSELSLEQSRINMDNELANLERTKKLYEAGGASKVDLENDELSYNRLKLTYEQAQASYESVCDKLNAAYNDAQVTSPISGVIGSVDINKGQMYNGSTAMTVVDINSLYIQTQVNDKVINACKAGQAADIYIPSVSKEPFKGYIQSIGTDKDSLSSSYPVKIAFNNHEPLLKPGMYGEIYLELEKHDDAVVIPKQAILTEDNVSFVFLADGDKAKKVNVTTGIKDGEKVEVIGEIKTGDLVIIDGQKYVNDGSPLSVAERV